jgi:hypothetical protein
MKTAISSFGKVALNRRHLAVMASVTPGRITFEDDAAITESELSASNPRFQREH